jgi:protein involved in polysaccharide export with SLBB domain
MGGGMASDPAAPSPNAAAVVASDVMRVGDKVTIRLTGVPDGGFVIESQIPSTGEVTVPLLTRTFPAAGRNTADLAADITAAYKAAKIYTTPNVSVIPEERFVNVGGDVRSPSRVNYTPDLTLLTAINSCGGFTEFANRHAVRILRGQQTITVDAAALLRNAGTDPPVYPGDQIFVPRTMF